MSPAEMGAEVTLTHERTNLSRVSASITVLSVTLTGWRTHGVVCHVCEADRRHRQKRDVCATLS
jgi:hypothetical protein